MRRPRLAGSSAVPDRLPRRDAAAVAAKAVETRRRDGFVDTERRSRGNSDNPFMKRDSEAEWRRDPAGAPSSRVYRTSAPRGKIDLIHDATLPHAHGHVRLGRLDAAWA